MIKTYQVNLGISTSKIHYIYLMWILSTLKNTWTICDMHPLTVNMKIKINTILYTLVRT